MIKAVIADFDDTLVFTIGPKIEQHIHAAREYNGTVLTPGIIMRHWGEPLPLLIKNLYGVDGEQADRAFDFYRSFAPQYPKRVKPGAHELISHLKESGLFLGIVTATVRPSIEMDIETLGIDAGAFPYIQTAEDTEHHKPDHRVFSPLITMLKERGIVPGEMLYFGDSLHDLMAARGAGMNFIGVPNGVTTQLEDFTSQGAIAVSSLTEFRTFFDPETHYPVEVSG